MFNNSMSPADMSALMGNNDGWGNSSWLWFIVIIFALFGGWGNGFGGNSGASENYVLASDFATLQRQIDSATTRLATQSNEIANGICSLGYDQLAQFNGINTNVLTTGNALQNSISNLGYQMQNCCCENRQNLADLKYTMATDTCAVTNNATSNTRDIIDNANANTKSILDFLVQDKLQTLQSENEALRLSASQSCQNQYLINVLRPSPIPSYPVANPYGYGYYGTTIQ